MKVSLLLCVYNGGPWLQPTLNSLENQRVEGLEIVLVDDGSEDGSGEVLRAFAKDRGDVVLIQRENRGLTASLIEAAQRARGDWLARLDSGDLCRPGRLGIQWKALQEHHAVACFSPSRRIDEKGSVLGEHRREETRMVSREDFLFDNPLIHSSAFFSREAFERAGGYDASFPVSQDFDLWVRLAEQGPLLRYGEALVDSRLDTGGISFKRKEEQARAAARVSAAVSRSLGLEDQELFWEQFHRIRLDCLPLPMARDAFLEQWNRIQGEVPVPREFAWKVRLWSWLGDRAYDWCFRVHHRYRYGAGRAQRLRSKTRLS